MDAQYGLPPSGPLAIGNVDLPPGQPVQPRLGDGAEHVPASLWATNEVLEAPGPVFEALRAPAAACGLVPVLLDDLQDRSTSGRPWDTGELGPPDPEDLDGYEVGAVLRGRWDVPISLLPPEEKAAWLSQYADFHFAAHWEDDEDEKAGFLAMVAPWGAQFPGLALPEHEVIEPVEHDRFLFSTAPARLGLALAGRSADVPHCIGWIGTCNGAPSGLGTAPLSVIMRSWEERFGARLLRLGFQTMEFVVERPPQTEASALAVAAEHFAFAGTDGLEDNGVSSIRELADLILNNPRWHFWWD